MKANKLNLYPYEATDEFGRLILPAKFGYAERPGDPFIIEPRFDMAYEFSDNIAAGYGPLAKVEVDGKAGIIYPDGSYFIKPAFDRIRDFSEGFAAVKVNWSEFEGDWGFIKPDGSYLVAPVFVEAEDFHRGYAKVKTSSEARGFIQPDGSYLLKAFSDIEDMIKNDSDWNDINIAGKPFSGKTGYINTNGDWLNNKPE